MSFSVVVTRPLDMFGFTLATDRSQTKFCVPSHVLDLNIKRNDVNLSRELRRKSIFTNNIVGFVSFFTGHKNKAIVFDLTEHTVTRETVEVESDWDRFPLREARALEEKFATFIHSFAMTRGLNLIASSPRQSGTLCYSEGGKHVFISGFTERYTDLFNLFVISSTINGTKNTLTKPNVKNAIDVERTKANVNFSTEKYFKIFRQLPRKGRHGYF